MSLTAASEPPHSNRESSRFRSAGSLNLEVMRRDEMPSAGAPIDDRGGVGSTSELARRVAESYGGPDAAALTEALAARVGDPACYEASVRRARDGELRTGRMMIERASREVIEAIAKALGVVLPPAARRWLDLAQGQGVPLISGWDRRGGGHERCVKLYVNASDASRTVRVRLCAALAPEVAEPGEPPAVLGMNVRADGLTETKLYVQSADARTLAGGAGERAAALAAAACGEDADAGAVLSFDVAGSTLRPRAFFVALREPRDGNDWRCIRSLAGYNRGTIDSLLPFPPAPPRSVGISLSEESWTVYFKPHRSGRAPEALEPVAIFRLDGTEVGVFVEPTEHAARAFRRTERHAVSVRLRHGTPDPLALESLVDWFTRQLRATERDGARIATRLDNPPAPWHLGDSGPGESARGRS